MKALSRIPVFLPTLRRAPEWPGFRRIAIRRAVVNMGRLGRDIDSFPTREWIPVFHQGTASTLLARVGQVPG
ncbi:MAG TPA: hypothetical protein VFD30_15665 [Terriglobia bacterium]|nr:hypothetical protein [Terriglobia bacterium]